MMIPAIHQRQTQLPMTSPPRPGPIRCPAPNPAPNPAPAMPQSASEAGRARMRPTPRRRIRTHGFTRRHLAPAPRCASSVEEGQKTVRGTVFPATGLMENRSGLIAGADLTRATGRAERQAAIGMIHRHSPGPTRRLTPGADKGYDAAEFVADLRQACGRHVSRLRHACVTPHAAQKSRYSAVDGRTTRHKGCALSLRHRKRIEQAFGRAKTVGGAAQTAVRGIERAHARFIMTMAAGNLARLPKLLAA